MRSLDWATRTKVRMWRKRPLWSIYKRLRTGEVFTAPRAFLYRTADHLVQKQFDRQKRAQNCITLDEVIEIPAQNADPDERLTFEEYSRQISAALSDTDAALFSMRYIEDL